MPEPQTQTQPPQIPTQIIVIRVGMHCEGCRRKVKKALATIPGIEELKFDLKEQKVTIRGAVDVKRMMSKLAKTGKVNELLSATPAAPAPPDSNKAKESPAPAAPPAAAAASVPAPVTLATSASATEASILKEMPIKPMVWINAPDFLSDENPNACSIM